jgi:hypothetical protein
MVSYQRVVNKNNQITIKAIDQYLQHLKTRPILNRKISNQVIVLVRIETNDLHLDTTSLKMAINL